LPLTFLVLAASACSASSDSSGEVSATTSTVIRATAPATTTTPEPHPQGVSDIDPSLFWEIVVETSASEVEVYSSFEEMATQADLVVLAGVESLGMGRIWGHGNEPEAQLASLVIQLRVDTLIRGDLPSDLVSLEHAMLGLTPDGVRALAESGGVRLADGSLLPPPSESALYFLSLREDQGSELVPSQAPFADGRSYRFVSRQGLVVDADGAVMPLQPLPPDDVEQRDDPGAHFAKAIRGADFDGIVASITGPSG